MDYKAKKIAIVHDFLENYGGAESVLESFCELFPQAPIYTLIYNRDNVQKWDRDWIANKKIKESFLQKAPGFLRKRKKYLLPLMPTAVEALNLREYDLVISSSSAFSKGIVIKPKTTHICYMHGPMRYVWDWNREYLEDQRLRGKRKLFTRLFLNYLRTWDRASADRPDYIIANSQYTAQRIEKYYRRSSKVIYPPVKINDISTSGENSGYFLSVGRLSPYKRFDLIVDAFLKLNLPLVIVGKGQQYNELKKRINDYGKSQVRLAGWQPREKLIKLYQSARAFVFAAEDDFGIAPAEAMAAGKPVIALRRGGVIETVKEGITGEFFNEPRMEVLADGIRRFMEKEKTYKSGEIRKQAEKFSKDKFKKEIIEYIESV